LVFNAKGIIFGNKMPRGIFGHKREEITGI
jgi:hypothetical protein